jgi:uncharacterized DUF497 family protein
MVQSVQYEDARFEWYLPKAAQNLQDHNVSFEEARLAFDDTRSIDDYLMDDSHDEDRFKRLCLGKGRLLVVIYTERMYDDGSSRFRII